MVINEDPEWEAERSWQPCLSCLHESIKLTVGGIQNWRRRWWSPMAVVEARMHTRTAAAEHFQNMKHNYRLKEESLTLFALTREHNWHALQLSPVAAVPAHTAAFGTPRTKKRTHWSVVVVERTLVSWRVFPRQSGQRACPCVRGLHHTHSPGSARKDQFSALVCGSNWCSHVASAATGREVSFIACKTLEMKTKLPKHYGNLGEAHFILKVVQYWSVNILQMLPERTFHDINWTIWHIYFKLLQLNHFFSPVTLISCLITSLSPPPLLILKRRRASLTTM